ncbi:MAG: hypothetical protein ACI4DO_06690 [Roseburia sp.]
MYFALNMELEIVRTILQNEVNDIYVCTDVSKDTGVFYTMVSIGDANYRKMIAEKVNTEGLFFKNQDYVGSFVYSNKLNLVFRYHQENLLSLMGEVYLYRFTECKTAAVNLVAAFAEAGVSPEIGMLLLNSRNINISKDGDIDLNYFLDFAEYKEEVTEEEYINLLGEKAFSILEMNYKEKYHSPDIYPSDLRLYYMKLKHQGFHSLGQIINTIRGMSDSPMEMRGVVWWFRSRIRRTRGFLFRNAMHTFLTIMVLATIVYAGVQISKRVRANRVFEENVSYNGLEYIGDVYLGN